MRTKASGVDHSAPDGKGPLSGLAGILRSSSGRPTGRWRAEGGPLVDFRRIESEKFCDLAVIATSHVGERDGDSFLFGLFPDRIESGYECILGCVFRQVGVASLE